MSPSSQNNSARNGKGRQKMNMVKIENEANLQVTFSKRRAGLFKKASELSTLCGAEIAVIVFSPRNKVHSFGHPNMKTISNRFLNESSPPMSDAHKLLEARHRANISQQTLELNQVERQLELEKKRARALKHAKKFDIKKFYYDQLSHLKGDILHFQQEFEAKVQNAINSRALYVQGPHTNLGKNTFQMPRSNLQYGNRGTIFRSKGKSICGGPSTLVRYDPGAGSSNAQVGIPTMIDDFCPIIPYSSTANPKSPGKF